MRSLALAATLALLAGPARAATPGPMTAADLGGIRALSLGGAFRGLTGGNEGIFLNAASLAAQKRYSLEAQFVTDRTGADTDAQWLGLSVVDSAGASVAAGMAYTRFPAGKTQGNAYHLALATPIGESLFFGVTGKYFQVDGPGDRVRDLNADAGLYWRVNSYLSLGAAGYNLLSSSHREQMPRGAGVGIALGDERSFHVVGDWRGDFDRKDAKLTNAWSGGVEYLLAEMFPLRAGFVSDDTLGGSFWTAGAGIVTAGGVALDVGYRQAVDDGSRRTVGVALKMMLPGM
ncbi:PorV/PorQ family protein [Anaeromyxobacter paludicola]|uniref:PorV/PorQ family protein n=1 Tax=Anaeromyxobacter paludicola TaxID=2918171 RepID=A0ABM7XEY1_9BACT|nr:hypothetical protein [Anaeromyxobacter paludicola]BDG10450.1 hypothetical protein AMPC_35630 [Anaeromyxobacter paludicola]